MEQENKLVRRMKEDPAVPVGVAGLIMTCIYGAYKYRTARKTMSTSVFLMQLRVAAQGAVVGCITLGVLYKTVQDYFKPENPDVKK